MSEPFFGGLRTTLVLTLTGIMIAGVLLISVVVLRVTERMVVREEARAGNALLSLSIHQLAREYDPGRSPTNPANRVRIQALVTILASVENVEASG